MLHPEYDQLFGFEKKVESDGRVTTSNNVTRILFGSYRKSTKRVTQLLLRVWMRCGIQST